MVGKVTQDLTANSLLWHHYRYIPYGPIRWYYLEVLVTVPKNADPDTPQATELTKFTWKSETHFDECVYQLYNEKQVLPFFGYPTTFLETKEKVNGVECEKWSNKDKSGPYTEYWAVWYAINAHPPYSVVLRAEYNYPPSRPHQFPVPGCSINYTFSDFTTDPIDPKVFAPPDKWLTGCTNGQEGLKKYNLPDRQDGYVCVTPNATNTFEIALFAKPENGSVQVKIRHCNENDTCIDGAGCKDCVKLNTTQLVFTADNWSMPQTIQVTYLRRGNSQFRFESSSYLNNTYDTQFSTCSTNLGPCTRGRQLYCD